MSTPPPQDPAAHSGDPGAGVAGTPGAELRLSVNGEPRTAPAGATLAEVVAGVTRAPSGVAAAVNEAVVPRSAWRATVLADRDRVEILTAVQGG